MRGRMSEFGEITRQDLMETNQDNIKYLFQSIIFYNLETLDNNQSNKGKYEAIKNFHTRQERNAVKRWIHNEGEWRIGFGECCEYAGLDSDKVVGSLSARGLV